MKQPLSTEINTGDSYVKVLFMFYIGVLAVVYFSSDTEGIP